MAEKRQRIGIRRRLLFLFAVFVAAAPLYVLAVIGLYRWRIADANAMTILTGAFPPGVWGHAAQRFKEAETAGPVDVVVVGSSHAYRSIDPRVFEKAGLRLQHIGSQSQTPVNSYFVMRRYLPRLKPRVVLVETGWRTLTQDGLESLLDLTTNLPHSDYLIDMSLRVRRVEGFNLALGRVLVSPDVDLQQRRMPGDTYVKGGYVERRSQPAPLQRQVLEIEPTSLQLEYLEKVITYAKSEGAEVLLVVQPMPKELVVSNAEEIRATLTKLAKRNGSDYVDYPPLDSNVHYGDERHLSQAGAVVFTNMVLETMKSRGLVAPKAEPAQP